MRIVDAEAVRAIGYRAAIDAITAVLQDGFDPTSDPARSIVDVAHGQFLLMPSQTIDATGVKVVTIAPDNPTHGLPRIAAAYLLFDAETLQLQALVDGVALTELRTPAVSVAAARPRLPDRPLDVVIVGSGPQALGHAAALDAVASIGRLTYLVRDPARASVPAVALAAAAAALGAADVVVCATSAGTPLFDSSVLRDEAIVIAVGSHTPDARELDAALFGRATVVVEDRATALREAGDVVLAIADGVLTENDLVPMHEVLTGRVAVPADRPFVFKSVGMAWQDLVVARLAAGR